MPSGRASALVRVAAVLPLGAALPEQVPALVELDLDPAQALVLLAGRDLAVGQRLAQPVLLVDQRVDAVLEVQVVGHVPSLAPRIAADSAESRWTWNAAPVADLFADAGSLREHYASVDWSATSLGPVEEWSTALRNAVGVALNTRFPVTLMWGPEYVLVYNEAYVEMIAGKHPARPGPTGVVRSSPRRGR